MSLAQLRAVFDRPNWSKDVVVWVGNRGAIDSAIGGLKQLDLDLLDLLPDDDALPPTRDQRAELLDMELLNRLRSLKPDDKERVVLRVRNAAILAANSVGLRHFYDWFAGSRTMSILEIEPLRPISLPSNVADVVKLDPSWLPDYFRPLLANPDRLLVEAE